MPILPPEPDCYPADLLELIPEADPPCWLAYTKSRQEKKLMRELRHLEIHHYGPQVAHRRRSPAGRVRTTYVPLFNNYVFIFGDEKARYGAVCTGAVTKITAITDGEKLVSDLIQIHSLINLGAPLTIESRLQPGQRVRVKTGSFAGYEGIVIQRHQETRLLVAVQFMEQGVSVKLDDCQLEPLELQV
ncbi:transcription termination/antitermination NusG family protein [Planctomycetes bacterium K23_9]|uniref:Transcriptional activator RfaH n=1 Tax=Stieleria marina TaxID=1930275 RepID=A0A517P170_9BACT|nr:transcriptional activator RfaH [Planctomycetes bacterium K23_9]